MRKSTKIDFFVLSPEAPDIDQLLKNLDSQPINSSKRTTQPTDDWVRLERGSASGGGYFGDMMRISMAPPGFRANVEGAVEPIMFNNDEGIGECTAFYYDFETRILVWQRNSKAVSINQFAHYLKTIGDFGDDIVILPVVRPTDIGKVKTLTQIRKIHISANIIDVMPTLDNIDATTKSVIQNSMLAESPGIELILKSARDKEATLNQTVAVETIESWLRIHDDFSDDENDIVKKIEVTGKDDSGETIEFDMLKDRMFTRMDYEWVPNMETLWDNRLQKIQQAWDLNHANLKRNLAAAQEE